LHARAFLALPQRRPPQCADHPSCKRSLAVFALWALSACAYDTSTIVNVAPSAEDKLDAIQEAVVRLNERIGMDTYTVQSVDSEDKIDGQVVIRCTQELGENGSHETRVGNTQKTRDGVLIRIAKRATPSAIAHELGHAAGLEHVNDEKNLMYRVTAPDHWGLNEEQLSHLRELF
jgi:predicted Zn-dependent protease